MAIVAAGFVLWRFTPLGELLDRETLIAELEAVRRSHWAAPLMIGLLTLMSLAGAPITPIILANGAVFGPFWGACANLLGCFLGGLAGFVLARALGSDLFNHLLRRTGIERLEAILESHGFWTLVRIRFLPIPYGLVNYAAGLTPIRPSVFFGGSALPLVPVVSIYTYVGHALLQVAAEDAPHLLWVAGAALVGLFLLSWLPGVRSLRREVGSEPEEAV